VALVFSPAGCAPDTAERLTLPEQVDVNPPAADIELDRIHAMSGGFACVNQGLASAHPDYVASYVIKDPPPSEQTFDGRRIRSDVGLRARAPTRVYGYQGNLVPWRFELWADEPGASVFVTGADWYSMSPPCFLTTCSFYIDNVPLLGQYTRYQLVVETSEGNPAFVMAVVPPPLQNWISGPTVLPALQHGTWVYGATGGGTPYSTTWYKKEKWTDYFWVGNGTTYTTFSSECDGDFWLKAVTTSPNGMSAESVVFVDVVPTPNCRR